MSRDRFAGIRRVLRIRNVERDLDDELAFHFEQSVEELMRQGLSRQNAEAEAHRRFGNEQRYRRELARLDRRAESNRRLALWGQDVRYAVRRMGRWPGLTAGIVLTFALGIGANATMFGIIDRLLLRPPEHIVEPERVTRPMIDQFVSWIGMRQTSDIMGYPDYVNLKRVESFSDVAAFTGRELTLGRGEEARRRPAVLASDNFFALLGVQPALGRFWAPEEDAPGAEGTAVIGYDLWQQQFGGDRSVLGQTIDFGHGAYTIIGVTPRNFTGVNLSRVDVWLPLLTAGSQLMGSSEWITSPNWIAFRPVARLAPGATSEQAVLEATTLHRQARADEIAEGKSDPEARVLVAPLIAARGPLATSESAVAKWLLGVSLIVLLIACANVANLLLARMIRQQRETGIRLALGISRGRLLAQTLTESLVLAMLGAAAALLVTHWGGSFVRNVLLPDIVWGDAVMDLRVLVLVLVLTVVTGVLAAVAPALQANRAEVQDTLRSGGRTLSPPALRTRNALTVLQAALSVVLLVGAGLFVRSLQQAQALDLGIDPEGVVLIQPVFEQGLAADRKREFYRQAAERLAALPGVEHISASVGAPFVMARGSSVQVPGIDSIPRLPGGGPYFQAVQPGYFPALGLQIQQGRGIAPEDVEGAPRVAVVSELMARTLWPEGSAVGKCLILAEDAPCTEVVGVVEDARRFRLQEDAAMQFYVPLDQGPRGDTPDVLFVRVGSSPDVLLPTLQRELLRLEPGLRFAYARPLQDLVAPQLRSWQLGATMFTVFGFLALLVAAIGLYSVLAFAVAQRTHELGIRAALGATRERLMRMVISQGVALVVIGTVLGLIAALAASSRIEPLLFQTSPRDPFTFGAVAAVLLLVAILAAALPGWRATRVDPSEALRSD
jgi:predicted permease